MARIVSLSKPTVGRSDLEALLGPKAQKVDLDAAMNVLNQVAYHGPINEELVGRSLRSHKRGTARDTTKILLAVGILQRDPRGYVNISSGARALYASR